MTRSNITGTRWDPAGESLQTDGKTPTSKPTSPGLGSAGRSTEASLSPGPGLGSLWVCRTFYPGLSLPVWGLQDGLQRPLSAGLGSLWVCRTVYRGLSLPVWGLSGSAGHSIEATSVLQLGE